MGAKCPTKPGKFSESVSVEKLNPLSCPLFKSYAVIHKVYMGSVQLNPARELMILIR